MFVIPAIDLKDGKCVRLRQGAMGEVTLYSDDPVAMAKTWEDQGANLIHIVDLDGAFTGECRNLLWVEKICKAVQCNIQLGGGLRSTSAIQNALQAGASRVVLGTKALSEPFLKETLSHFQEAIVVGIDARDSKVTVQGWTEQSKLDAFEFAIKVSALGAQRIIFTDVQTDGMLSGPPLDSIRKLCTSIPASVIASGGVGKISDVRALQALKFKNLEGVIVGKALYEKRFKLQDAR